MSGEVTYLSEIMGEVDDDTLEHFGIKGMHWGQSRERGASGRVSGTASPTPKAPKSPSKSQLIKADRTVARRELRDRDVELTAALKARKLTAKGSAERAAADKKVDELDNAWVDTYSRANKTTTGETARGIGLTVGSIGVAVGAKYAASYIVNNPEKVASFLKGSKQAASGLKAIGSMGRNLPYAKIAKGAYQVTKLR